LALIAAIGIHEPQLLTAAAIRHKDNLRLIKDAILTLPSEPVASSDFEATLSELQRAFTNATPLTDQARDDARYAYLLEKYGA
jgi:hypothetical protein